MSPPRPDPARGVFETLLVRDGRVQALERHLDRLAASVHALYGEALPDEQATELTALVRGRRGSHRLRVCARPCAGGVAVEADIAPLDAQALARPVALQPARAPGGHGSHKWVDRRALAASGPDTPLLLDGPQEALEAAWGNVWIREGARIVTPPADGRLLPGVTRARLLALAPDLGLARATEPVSLARLRAADEVFLTSSLRQAVPAALGIAPGGPSPALAAVLARLAAADWT